MRRYKGYSAAAGILGTVLGVSVYAEPSGSGATAAAPVRSDLSRAYRRFESAFLAAVPHMSPEDIAGANRAFDGLTGSFFAGDWTGAIKLLNESTRRLTAKEARLPETPESLIAEQMLAAVRVRLSPTVYRAGSNAVLTASVEWLYAPIEIGALGSDTSSGSMKATANAPQTSEKAETTGPRLYAPGVLELLDAKGDAVLATPLMLATGPGADHQSEVRFPLVPRRVVPGAYRAILRLKGDRAAEVAGWNVTAESLDLVRARNAAELDRIAAHTPEMKDALLACKMRNNLLTDTPPAESTVYGFVDLYTLSAEVAREIEELQRKRNPYRRRAGDYWRGISYRGVDVPMRVYAPSRAGEEDALPLVIALHGMGGDENMFMEGYGAGLLKRLADQYGFVAVSPVAYGFVAQPALFDVLVDAISLHYEVDPTRIYVVGHSMGAGAAAGLARQRIDRIAAACCIAGGGIRSGNVSTAPVLVYAGALDPLFPVERMRRGVEQARSAGAPVEFRVAEHYGHTLVVGAVLEECVEWLLTRRLVRPQEADRDRVETATPADMAPASP